MGKDTDTKELTSKEGKHLEDLFFGRCKENLQNVSEISNPLQNDSISVSYAEEHYEPHSLRKSVKRIMEENEIYDKALLGKLPRGRYFHYTVYDYGLFDKKAAVIVSIFVRGELADFVKEGKSSTPVPVSEVEAARLDAMERSELFHYIAVFGLCGFAPDVYSLPLSGPNWELALVTHVEGTAWKIVSGEKTRRETVLALFDPEKESEKLWRARSIIKAAPDLNVSGGFIILSDIVQESGLAPEIVRRAAEEFCAQDKSLDMERVEGKLILKRSRT
jgi:hypothetical protein